MKIALYTLFGKVSVDCKYIFPEYCRIAELAKVIPESKLKEEEITNNFVVFNKSTKSIFTINNSIKNLLERFNTPRTLLEVKNEILIETNTKKDEEKAIIKFLQILIKRKFIMPVDSVSQLDKSNKKIEQFEIIETIKQSNFETICLATDKSTNQRVILKFLIFDQNAALNVKTKRREYFNQEFGIMKELTEHPLVCKLYLFDKKRDLAILEYVKGKTLKELTKNGELQLMEKIVIIKQLIEVMSFVHQKGIIHGDIHANQFLIDYKLNLKLIDFGFSYYYNSKNDKQIIRRGGIHNYLEPENIASNAFVNVNEYTPSLSSEIYRIGVLLYFIVYESYPFESFSWKRLYKLIKTEKPKLRKHTPKGEIIPNDILRIIKKSLSKTPKMRYCSALEIKSELKTLQL